MKALQEAHEHDILKTYATKIVLYEDVIKMVAFLPVYSCTLIDCDLMIIGQILTK